MRLFSHPVNHFLSTWRNFFRCVSFQGQCRCAKGELASRWGLVSTKFFFFYQFVAVRQGAHFRLAATGADFCRMLRQER